MARVALASSLEMTVSPSPDFDIRDSRPSDFKFIWDSWLQSWRRSPWAGVIPNNQYFAVTRSSIEQLVGRGAEFKVACSTEDPAHILAWLCYEVLKTGECVIHYAYTKDAYLQYEPNRALLEASPGTKPGFCTYLYRQVSDLCPKSEGWRHAPEIARRR